MMIKFKAKVLKGNNNLTGFVKFPKEGNTRWKIGCAISVRFVTDAIDGTFFSSIRTYYSDPGFYVPREIMVRHELSETSPTFYVGEVDGFSARIGFDGRIYLPVDKAREQRIQHNAIIQIKSLASGRSRFSRVSVRKKIATTEYRCNFDPADAGKIRLFTVNNLTNREKEYSPMMRVVLQEFDYAPVDVAYGALPRGQSTHHYQRSDQY